MRSEMDSEWNARYDNRERYSAELADLRDSAMAAIEEMEAADEAADRDAAAAMGLSVEQARAVWQAEAEAEEAEAERARNNSNLPF